MNFRRFCFLSFFLVWSVAAIAQSKSPFRVISPESGLALQAGETKTVSLSIEMPPNYFIYKDKTSIEFLNLEGILVKNIQYPSPQSHQDPFFKKTVSVFQGTTQVDVTFQAPQSAAPGKRNLEALLKLQGCSDSLCYPEESHLIVFNLNIVSGGATHSSSEAPFSWRELFHTQDFSKILEQGWWVVLMVVFFGGVLTSFTPCVLPLIPITLMIIGVRAQSPVRKNLVLSCCLVLGLALTYALLGVAAVAFGKSLGFAFQQKWFVIFLALLFFALSLSMFGFYEIHLPSVLRHRINHIKGHGKWGAFVSGAAAGVVAAPCAGPIIGAMLLFIAGNQNYTQGFLLLLVYALGMGVLFVILGTGYGTLQGRFRKFPLSIWIKRIMGLVLFGISLFYINTVVPLEKGLAYFGHHPQQIVWLHSEPQGLEMAKRENKVMMIDFYADWCAPCKELDLGFFNRKEVMELIKQLVPVRVDATFSGKPEVEAALNKYKVVGWPTVIFVGPDGKVLQDLTMISYRPNLLLENIKKSLVYSP